MLKKEIRSLYHRTKSDWSWEPHEPGEKLKRYLFDDVETKFRQSFSLGRLAGKQPDLAHVEIGEDLRRNLVYLALVYGVVCVELVCDTVSADLVFAHKD
mmetsp:Transcript_371/g.1254  ORF Transcript_371/g.1254 Transcript_371/m.1254 type:complete len:99 (-) Transcript_371:1103-1399(-)